MNKLIIILFLFIASVSQGQNFFWSHTGAAGGGEDLIITTVSLTVINGTSISATGETAGNSDEMGFVYNTTGNPTILDNKVTHSTTTGEYTDTLVVATCGVLYYIRAYATKGIEIVYGDVLTATSSNAGFSTVSLLETERSSCGTFSTSSLATCQALLDNLRNNTCDNNGYSDTYTGFKMESVTIGKKMYYGGGNYCSVATVTGWNIYNPFGGAGNSIIVNWGTSGNTVLETYVY